MRIGRVHSRLSYLHCILPTSNQWRGFQNARTCSSAFFCFLALYAYVRYTEQPSLRRYLLMTLPFCLGLMSKSMLVTFPFMLILLDIWPLRARSFRRSYGKNCP